MAVRDRLHRSELAVPGSNTRAMEKAPGLGADVVFLDLEDAVAPDDKEQARENVIAALTDQDWSACSVSVRINGLDTHWCYRDIVEVVERAGSQLDTILIPKVGTPADVLFVATMLDQIEAAFGLEPINLHILIETALGMANVEAIAQTCPERLEAMVFGVADYAASTQARTTNIGGSNPDYATLTARRRVGRARAALGRPVALRAVADGRRLPRLRAAADRRAVRRLPGSRRATPPPRAAQPSSAARASGRSTPPRSRSRTRCSHRHRRRSTGPAGSSRRCSRRRPRARARSRWTES